MKKQIHNDSSNCYSNDDGNTITCKCSRDSAYSF